MPLMPTIDQRFWLLQRLLLRNPSWRCVFAVDLSDVDVLRTPSCDFDSVQAQDGAVAAAPRSDEERERLLLLGSDNCGDGVKRWVLQKGQEAGFNETWTPAFRAFLLGGRHSKPPPSGSQPGFECIINCGVIGGWRPALLLALAHVVRRLVAVWRAPVGRERLASHALRDPVGDMVAWNEYARESLLPARTLIAS